jgi:hypothetical protein
VSTSALKTVIFMTGLTAGSLFGQAAASKAPATGKPVDFQREVRPILSDKCFHCHGPDSSTRLAGLRLDERDAAFEVRKRGAAIVPGKPQESMLFQRITAAQPARRMPPASSHKTLDEQQISVLKRWIEQGAKWEEHWSFRPPVKSQPPSVKAASWTRNPIDRFVLARLEKEGLTPAPEADRRTLIRRVALDATGLPPRQMEIDQFLKDTAPGAYERMVDRYLASPHYGEHRARYWLDAARYGDTHGIHIDNYREIWPYRDWVIGAFNRNLPFDKFSIEQLAGDLLPNPTLDQKVATGFQRCNITTSEGGAIDDEYIEIYAKDRADTTGAVWLGLTVGCATCHDHKFDPISQKDFYALGAFFRNTPQRAMDGNVADTPPFMFVPGEEDREAWQKLQTERSQLRGALEQAKKDAVSPFEKWQAERKAVAPEAPITDGSQIFAADLQKSEVEGISKLGDSPFPGVQALHFQKDEGVDIEKGPKMDADKPFSASVIFFHPKKTERTFHVVGQQNLKEKARGWAIEVNRRIATFRLVGDDGRVIDARTTDIEQFKPGTWNHIAVSYDGSRAQTGIVFYLNGKEILTQGRVPSTTKLLGSIEVKEPLVLGRALAGSAIADFRLYNRILTESEVGILQQWPAIAAALAKTEDQLTAEDKNALLAWYLAAEYEPTVKLGAQLARVNASARQISKESPVTLVMYEKPESKPMANILFRGAYDQKREAVEASTPSVLPPIRAGLPRNRLGLANWLFSEDNPLTARVTVNRMWQELFGIGIVKTTDDFGSQGEPPTNPQLLDWLALDFRENGWDVKRFYKQILLSATYRQSAKITPDKLSKDPDNRMFSRGPRFRMDAEMVRDYALAASGLLSRGIGGPSVRPYQPDGIWEAVAMDGSNTRFYKQDQGEGLYRRSMYTFWKRSAPPASMDIFNAPSREACTVRRERTNTPLQALVTMNDTQFMEAARILAERAMQTETEFSSRISYLAQNILARPLNVRESGVVEKEFADFQAYYKEHPEDARRLLKTGERQPDPTLPAPTYAALTLLTNQLLNLDEVLNK